MIISTEHFKTLTELCNLPTAPYAERHVIGYLLAWAKAGRRRGKIKVGRDPAGNVYLEYKRGRVRDGKGKAPPPLVIEAHMDHPGFWAVGMDERGRLRAEFRGGVRPSYFKGAVAAFWVEEEDVRSEKVEIRKMGGGRGKGIRPEAVPRGRWVRARVLEVREAEREPKNYQVVLLELADGEAVPAGSLGMWDLPDARVLGDGKLFAARVCDDIAGVAAGLCLLDELIAGRMAGHVIVMASRAEEVGFAGVLAAVTKRWVPKGARVIGLETSKSLPAAVGGAAQGAGVVIRVGDKAGIFSAGLTHFIAQAAGAIGDEDVSFKWQRKLMDAGTCNSTAFTAFGYDAAGLTLPLGNYHNMTNAGEPGWDDGGRTGPGIGSETIHLEDFAGLVRLLVEVVKQYDGYRPRFGVMRERLRKLHVTEQRGMLFGTSDQSV